MNPDTEIDDLITKVTFLLDSYELWSEDGHFTFPDGDTWDRSHRMPEVPARPSWDDYFFIVAAAVRTRADCRRARYGAVIVKNHRVVATGYNGSPSGGPSCLAGECPRGLLSKEEQIPLTGSYENCVALHAEQNAIAHASYDETNGATIYIYGGLPPCPMCDKMIKAAGIERIMWR